MTNPTETWLAGDLRIDPGLQRVERDGQAIVLPPLSFDVLLALVRAAPAFVSNDDLMSRVWVNQVVSLETVTQRIKLVRDALGDDPREPRYIEGLRGRGYRCIAVVAREVAAHEPAVAAAVSPTPPPERWRPGIPWLAGLTFLAVVLFTALHSLTDRQAGLATARLGLQPPLDRTHTVAVLPFDDLAPGGSDSFLALGLPDMILNRLAGQPGLTVIARSSSLALPSRGLDAHELGTRLNSAYLVEGSVQHAGERLRIAVRLVETARGTQLWSTHIDRGSGELFALEDDLAMQVSEALAGQLRDVDGGTTHAERSSNLEAYMAYLQGRARLGRYSLADSHAAIPHFERAVALDPGFAAAHVALYDARMQAGSLERTPLADLRARNRPLIDRALALNPQSGAAQFALAMWNGGSEAEREAAFRRGLALDPSNGRGLTAFAEFLGNVTGGSNVVGPSDEADRVLQRALWIDPMSPRAHFAHAMRSLEGSGVAALEREMLQVIELDPDFVPALQRYAKYQWEHHGTLAEAVRLIEHAIAVDPGNPWLRHTAVAMYLDLDDVAAAADVAAGTPQSAASARLLLALKKGDVAAAARAAHAPDGWQYNAFENWEAGEALRDDALRTGELAASIAIMRERFRLPEPAALHLGLVNFRQAFYLSQLLAAQGRSAEAVALRQAVSEWNDANEPKYGPVFARRLRAGMLLTQGRREAALDELEGSFRSLDYMHWWYTLDRDPIWLPLHQDARFIAIATRVHQHVDAERLRLAQLRRDGVVPQRPLAAPGASHS